MAKLGKYSTGLKGSVKRSTYAGHGNDGYAKRENMMGANGMTKHEDLAIAKEVTAQGNPSIVVTKRIKRKM